MPKNNPPSCDGSSPVRISKSIVEGALPPPMGGRRILWDSELKGFGVRITSAGTRTYILKYRMGGRDAPARMFTIGQHGSPFTAEQARRRAAEKARQGPIFSTNGKTGISGFSKMKEAIDASISALIEESDLARELVQGTVAPWVVHDLRRSLATGCQAMGIDLLHTEAVLNHALGKKGSAVAGVYHVYDYYSEKAEALARWGELIEQAVALFRAGDLDGLREIDPARRAKAARRRPRRRA